MNCTECLDRMEEYALGSLPDSLAEAIASHLATGCAECNHELDECHAAIANYATAIVPEVPPAKIKQKLLDRVRESQSPVCKSGLKSTNSLVASYNGLATTAPSQRRRGSRFLIPLLATAGALLIGVFASTLFTQAPVQAQRVQEYQDRQALALKTFSSSNVQLAALGITNDDARVAGHLICDGLANQIHVFAFDFAGPPADHAYYLWLGNRDDQWLPLGELKSDPHGTCSAVLDVPAGASAIVRAMVTEEPPTEPANSDLAKKWSIAKPRGIPRLIANF